MYWFIYRNYLEHRWLFWDGKEENLRHCLNQDDAKKWYNSHKENMVTIDLKRPPNKVLKVQIPLAKWAIQITSDFAEYIQKNKVETRMQNVLGQLLDEYDVDASWMFAKRRKEKEVKKEDFWVLMAMRDIIEWMCRIEPIQVQTGIDKNTQQALYSPWEIANDLYGVTYEVDGKKHKTNLFGVYVPAVRQAMFPDSDFDGSTLQKWQRDYLFKRWKITFVFCTRWAGKSLSTTSLAGNYILKQLTMPFENHRPFTIHYFGLSRESNTQVAWYIRKMMLSLIDNKRVVERRATEQRLTVRDWNDIRTIFFKSQYQEWVGRWERPNLVVIDEADRMDEEVYKTAVGTVECPIICISTIDYDSKKSWMSREFSNAQIKQRNYPSMSSKIHEIRMKYGMDKCKSRDDYWVKIQNGDFMRMRDDLYEAFPKVALKYSIDDVDRYSESQKKQLIEDAMSIGEDYCLAELYSEHADEITMFNTEWLMEHNIPDMFDEVTLGYDESDGWDNPAVVVTWFEKNMAYVLHEESLLSDPLERYRRLKELINIFRGKSKKNQIITACDITRWDAYFREIEERLWLSIDVPVYYTKSQQDDVKIWRPKHKVGKRYLVKMTKDEFFLRGNILFSTRLSTDDKSLIDELKYFKRKTNGKYEAVQGKDDKVNALMLSLYAAYIRWLKQDIDRWDFVNSISREELVDRKLMQQKAEEEYKQEEQALWKIYAEFW